MSGLWQFLQKDENANSKLVDSRRGRGGKEPGVETPMAMNCDKDSMPPVLRALLEDSEQPQMADRQVSVDGTRKYILRLHDDALIEMVAMPHVKNGVPGRLSVCYSTQVGCAVGCAFCATGRQGFTRNLDAAEMVWQLVIVEEDFGRPIDVAVAMGQGEPLANCTALIGALRVIADPEGLGVPEDKLAISTSGPVVGIRKFAESGKLIFVEHYPAVSHCAAYGYIEILAGAYRSRAVYAAYIAGSCPVNGCVIIMGASCAKIRYRSAPGCAHNAAGLGGYQTLMIDLCQKLGLYYLSLHQIRHHSDHGLTGIHYRTLRKCIYITCEAEIS